MATYDVIVLGTGGVGSSAVFHLAQRGCRVLGLDRYQGGHDQGSSHGHTRIIRLAYFEHPDYVPLLRRSYALWHELEQRAQRQLYYPVGLLEVGPPDGVVVPGVLASARQHQLAVEALDDQQLRERCPGFRLPEGANALFESNAGYLLVEDCVLTYLAQARRLGAELREHESVVSWKATPSGVTVRTERGEYQAGKLVITAGAWSGPLLASLGLQLQVRRKHLHWYEADTAQYRASSGGCCFFYEVPEGYFYGFPQLDEYGVKLAEHTGGTVVTSPSGDDRAVEVRDRERVERFLRNNLPGVSARPARHAVCYYTMSADEHFIVDRHPEFPSVCFTAGLSGHGFKFTSCLGEIMADLTCQGTTAHPIEFLSVLRPGLRG